MSDADELAAAILWLREQGLSNDYANIAVATLLVKYAQKRTAAIEHELGMMAGELAIQNLTSCG